MRHRFSCVMMACGLSLCMAGVAQAGGRYFSAEMGINIAPSVGMDVFSNDAASHCDVFNNPTPGAPDNHGYPSGCRTTSANGGPDFLYKEDGLRRDDLSEFDGAMGILAGTALGYSFADAYPNDLLGGLRLEAEYFFRESRYDQQVTVSSGLGASAAKLAAEFDTGPFSRLDSVTSHNLFGNVYYDLRNIDWLTNVVGEVGSRLTPYIGIGGGIGFTNAGWHSNWTRTANQDRLRQGLVIGGRPDLAATTTTTVVFEDSVPDSVELVGGSFSDGAARKVFTIDETVRQGLPTIDTDRNNQYITGLAGQSSVEATTLSDVLYGFQVLLGLDYAVTDVMSMGLKGRWVHFASFDDTFQWNPLRGHAPYVGGTEEHPTRPVYARAATDDIGFFAISVNMKYHF